MALPAGASQQPEEGQTYAIPWVKSANDEWGVFAKRVWEEEDVAHCWNLYI